jgi:beta-mannosidase
VTESVAPARERRALSEGWELARTAPGECPGPETLPHLHWVAADVPGTVAGAVADGACPDLDDADWWFRVTFEAEPAADGEQVLLYLGGLATVAEVYLNGALVLESDSMFAEHRLEVGDR